MSNAIGRSSRLVAAVASLILVALMASAALGVLSPVKDLSATGQDAGDPQLAAGPDSTMTSVWERFNGSNYIVQARRIAPSGTPDAIVHDLSAAGGDAFVPQVAVGSDGTATAVWQRFSGANDIVQARRIGPDGTPSVTINDLSASGRDAEAPQVALAPDGAATAVWNRFDGAATIVQARRIAPDGTVGSTKDLSASFSGRNAEEQQVAIGPDGVATVVWDRFDGSNTIVQARRIAPDGTPSATTHDLSAVGEDALGPQVEVSPDGTATVVWLRFNGSNYIVQARRIAPNGIPEAGTSNLSATGQDAFAPQVGVGPDGTATVAWERFDGSNSIVQARRIAPNGTPDASTKDLSATGQDAFAPQVGVGPDGTATVVWERFNGSNSIVQTRAIAPDGTPDASTDDLSAAGQDATQPQVAARSDSVVTAIWRRFNGSNDVIQGSSFPELFLSLEPTSHGFGSLLAGSGVSPSQTFTVTNTGPAALTISSVSMGGASPGQFDLVNATSCTSGPIPQGASCQVSVAFAPTAPGAQQAQLVVTSNASSSPDLASVTGTGIPSNKFKFGKPKRNRKKGTARLPVTVPWPGKLRLSGKGVVAQRRAPGTVSSRTLTKTVSAGGTVKLLVKSKGKKLRKLRRRGKVTVRVKVTYTPTGGTANSATRKVILKKRLRH